MSITLNPIGPWPVVAIASLTVMILTIWAYRQRLKGSTGAWRWVALGLRLAAVVLCLLAALRPSINLPEKKKQAAAVIFLIDKSKSLMLNDEVNGQSRWQVALKALEDAKKSVSEKLTDIDIKVFSFDSTLHDEQVDKDTKADGRETALGGAMLEAVKRVPGVSIASLVIIADGANNSGIPPLVAADQLKAKLIRAITVGVGDENAGAGSKDIAVTDFQIGPTVFVKNQPEIRGTISARGFANKSIDVELYVEGELLPVAKTTIRPTSGAEIIPVTGLKYLPQTPGEKRVTLKVKPQEGELVKTNNDFTTYLTVLKGGLKVLYVQGPNFSWEPRYLTRGLDAAKEIHVDLKVIRQPAIGDRGLLEDTDLAPGNYDVFILGDLPADHLTPRQQQLLASNVARGGAGLIMLGGRSSFGEGGWGNTPVAGILPVAVRVGDGQIEPPEGLKFQPNTVGLQNFILRLAPTPEESRRLWDLLPPLTGTNRFGQPKPAADVLAQAQGVSREPLMVSMTMGQGRTVAFGGETWPWARAGDEGRMAHIRFWRQAILWLAHKEDQGESEVKVKLDRRRLAVGQKLDLTAWARDAKKEPVYDVQFETAITRVDVSDAKPESVSLFQQGDESRGSYFASGEPGEYRVEVVGRKNGKEIGHDAARFNVYQDDRELENPAADRGLLRQIAEITGGQFVAPEELGKQLASLDAGATERVSLTEKRIWDNWYFFLIFATLLTLEWWLRKRKGWV
jgi:hypothetical protein